MVMTDPIADMLTRIRNANSVHHDKVEIPGSKIKLAIAEILKAEGFIKDFEVIADSKQNVIRVSLNTVLIKRRLSPVLNVFPNLV